MGFKKDLTGKVFGEWKVIFFSYMGEKNHTAYWKCRCSCGKEVIVKGVSLTNGASRSCHGNKKEITWEVNENGCWICTSHKPGTGGYPRGTVGRKNETIHRVMYEKYKGKIINDLHVLHTCDNRMCINPSHLFSGTNQDNIDDMVEKGRNKHCFGEGSPLAKLTEKEAHEIKYSNGMTHKQLAEKFSISRCQVSAIRSGTRWSHI